MSALFVAKNPQGAHVETCGVLAPHTRQAPVNCPVHMTGASRASGVELWGSGNVMFSVFAVAGGRGGTWSL